MSGAAVNMILEKIASKDKDFRYMATSDLLAELGKDSFKVDPELERRLCAAVAVQLEDASGDISGLAVKCLGLLVRKVGEQNAIAAVNDLTGKVVASKKESTRDIASIALKTVISELPPGSRLAGPAGAAVVDGMLRGVAANKESTAVASDCLDILGEAAAAFGPHVQAMHAQLLQVVLELMEDPRPAIRKRALHCLAGLSCHLSDALLKEAAEALLTKLEAATQGKGKAAEARTYVQAIGGVSRATGHRLGAFLGRALPLVVAAYRGAGEGEADDELREHCLLALESFVQRSPADARPQLGPVLDVALEALRHDPNFADDMQDDDDGGGGGSDDEDGDGSEEYSDDEDVSWKVRRAAAKLISTAVAAYPDLLQDVYARVAPALVSRFREREESVKAGVMAAYCDLVRQAAAASARHYGRPDDPSDPLDLLRADIPVALKAAAQQLGGRDVKTRAAAFGVLRALGAAAPAEVTQHLGQLVPGVLAALSDRSASASALKIEALCFLQPLLVGGDPKLLAPHLKALGGGLFGCVGERYYKVTAEALRACEALARCLRPAPPAPAEPPAAELVGPLLAAAAGRLGAQDQDQEVKEAAISCVARVIADLGDCPGVEAEVEPTLRALLERLRNETTRLPAVKAAAAVAASQLPLPPLGGAVAAGFVSELTSFLRKSNRALRAASLAALEALCARPNLQLDPASFAAAVSEAPSLLSDSDLSLAAEALGLYATLASSQEGAAAGLADQVLPAALDLVRSPLLQGAALSRLQAFLTALASAGPPAGPPAAGAAARGALIDALLGDGRAREAGPQAQASVARCVAALALLTMAASKDPAAQRLALLTLGQIGRRCNLGSAVPEAEAAVARALESGGEDARGAASVALGGLACGDLERSLPALCALIEAAAGEPARQYLLLQALNEVLSTLAAPSDADDAAGRRTGGGAAAPAVPPLDEGKVSGLLALLLRCAGGEEECAAAVVTALADALPAAGPPVRSAAAGAADEGRGPAAALALEGALAGRLPDFLRLVGDGDRHVRKAAVLALSSASHHRPRLVSPHLPELLPLLYAQTAVREELIRTVDLGPFKHKIDDGLDLRKAAFECLDILLDAAPAALDYPEFLKCLLSGLADHPDVRAPAHHMLSRAAAAAPGAVLAQLDSLVDPLEKTLTARLKSDAVKQEMDRHEESLRSCLRAVDALDRLPGAAAAARWAAFMQRTSVSAALKDKLAAVRAEREEAQGKGAAARGGRAAGDRMDLS
ncbi:MAG: armadillo-type protein [Monoraphidium minutum]|nr:MAG: armadillo-type protein [Monoraphidium minutum]